MAQLVLLTGGNLGRVADTLALARAELAQALGMEVACSSLWESEPWGFESSDRFLNQVVVIETELSPLEVLSRCQQIEQRHGRERDVQPCPPSPPQSSKQRYASRTLDIDILFYDNQCIDLPTLTVPHPRIVERLFVLCPLSEVLPDWVHPTSGEPMQALLEALRSSSQGSEPIRVAGE